MRQQVLGIDQYGNHYKDLGRFPRKALTEQLLTKHVCKMYVDTRAGETKHIGYIIAGFWITLYYINEWTGRKVI